MLNNLLLLPPSTLLLATPNVYILLPIDMPVLNSSPLSRKAPWGLDMVFNELVSTILITPTRYCFLYNLLRLLNHLLGILPSTQPPNFKCVYIMPIDLFILNSLPPSEITLWYSKRVFKEIILATNTILTPTH